MDFYLLCMEMRPLDDGVWDYEGRRATFERTVEITLRHPNPLAPMPPTRFQLPMVFTQHVPPAYTYRHGSPHPRRITFQRRIASSPRIPYTTGRAYRESFSRLCSRSSATRDFPKAVGLVPVSDVTRGTQRWRRTRWRVWILMSRHHPGMWIGAVTSEGDSDSTPLVPVRLGFLWSPMIQILHLVLFRFMLYIF